MKLRGSIKNSLIIINLFLAIVILWHLVPISHGYILNTFMLAHVEVWMQQPKFIAAWNRDLSQAEIDGLAHEMINGWGFYKAMEHLIHHSDEPLVIESLKAIKYNDEVNESNSNNNLITKATYILSRADYNPDEQWEWLVDKFLTGGLDDDHLYLLGIQDEPEDLELQRSRNRALFCQSQTMQIFAQHLSYEQDNDRLSDLYQGLESEIWQVRRLTVGVLRNFSHKQEVRDVLEGVSRDHPDESVREAAYYALSVEPYYTESHGERYRDYVIQNRIGFPIAMVLIVLMVFGSVMLYRYLCKFKNVM